MCTLFGVATVGVRPFRDFQASMMALILMAPAIWLAFNSPMLVQWKPRMRSVAGSVAVLLSLSELQTSWVEFESGLTAALFGLVPAVIIWRFATLAVTVLCMWKFPFFA